MNNYEDLHILKDLVLTSSKTSDISGVNKVQLKLQDLLNERGFNSTLIDNKEVQSARLLHAQKGDKRFPTIAYICHADSVLDFQNKHDFQISLEMNRAIGPGVADNKGGIVTMLNLIDRIREIGISEKLNQVVICSPNEELGSTGFHSYFKEVAKSCDIVFGMEPGLKNGNIISSRNGNRWYQIQIKGIQSHSGRFNQPSLNAAHESAYKIVEMHKLNDLRNKIRVNAGTISGGQGHFNVVCPEVTLKLDTRFPCFQTREELHERILEIINTSHLSCHYSSELTKSDWELHDDCPPMPYISHNEKEILNLVLKISKRNNKLIYHTHSGGAADINFFSDSNALLIDGLGACGSDLHTTHESICLNSLRQRPIATADFVADWLNNHTLHTRDTNGKHCLP